MYHTFDITHQSYEEALEEFKKTLRNEETSSWRIDFIADHAQSRVIRDIVGSIFDYYQLVTPWKGRFTLVTDELVNNAIEHGSKSGDKNYCNINIRQDSVLFHISIEIHDPGHGDGVKDPETLNEIREEKLKKDQMDLGKRGRWLFIITERIVDKLTFESSPLGGIMVKIEKIIPLPRR